MAEATTNWPAKENELGYHSITPTSLLLKLDQFLSHVSSAKNGRNLSENAANEEKAMQTALFLLKNLPPARSAALAYLGHSLSKEVLHFMQSNEPQTNKLATLEYRIETLLEELLEESPEAWAPLIAQWGVDQLGKWSVEWESILITRGDATLDEKVATWLTCGPVNSLSNLTVACVAADPDNTVAALLESSVNIGQPLDWLVAHVGCSFPCTIVTRVLSLGLDSFSSSPTSRVTKQLVSVNKILNHLGERHFQEIRKGLNFIFVRTFNSSPSACDKAAIPFLLRLASSSSSAYILNALTANIPSIIVHAKSSRVLESAVSWWIPKYFQSAAHLKDLLTKLLLDIGGDQSWSLLAYLIKSATVDDGHPINAEILDQLLSQLRDTAFTRKKKTNVPLLNALSLHVKDYLYDGRQSDDGSQKNTVISLIKWVITSDSPGPVKKLSHLLLCLVVHQGPDVAINLLKLLTYCRLPVNGHFLHVANVTVFSLLRHHTLHRNQFAALSSTLGDSLNPTIQFKAGDGDITDILRKWKAMINRANDPPRRLPSCPSGDTKLSQTAIASALQVNVCKLARLINIPGIGEKSFDLISHLPLGKPMSLSHLLMLAQSVVYYFYACLRHGDRPQKLRGAALCNTAFVHLSQSQLGHSLLLRLLFESAFRAEWSDLLGARGHAHVPCREVDDSLLRTNQQFGSWVKLPMSHNAIFHAGKIGRARVHAAGGDAGRPTLPPNEVALNTQLLLNALATCCRAQGSSAGATTIALLLVEYISPDIMFNGFPWPEENIKFTFERDLAIRKIFDEFPVVWHLLTLVARNRPALCCCSVLVRALTAAYTAFWSTFISTLDADAKRTLSNTKRLLEIIVIGQFLPECFHVVPCIVERLAPYEIVCVLQDVWTYLRNNTPSPDRWVPLTNGVYNRPTEYTDPRYIDRTRKLIMIHIESLGHLLPHLMANMGLIN